MPDTLSHPYEKLPTSQVRKLRGNCSSPDVTLAALWTHAFVRPRPHSSSPLPPLPASGRAGCHDGATRVLSEQRFHSAESNKASLVAWLVKNLPAMRETWVRSLAWDDSLEKGMATHSSILAWRIPGTVQSMGSQRVTHD